MVFSNLSQLKEMDALVMEGEMSQKKWLLQTYYRYWCELWRINQKYF
jgi:hypothetical protein